TMRDMIHPIFERVEIDATHRDAMRCHVQQTPKETFSGAVKIKNDDRIQFHIEHSPLSKASARREMVSKFHSFDVILDDELRLRQLLDFSNRNIGPQFLEYKSPVRHIDQA